MYTLFITLHVALAVFIVGPMAILPHTGLRAMRAHDAKQLGGVARSTNILTLLSLLVFVAGFGALGLAPKKYDFSFGDLWVWLSIVLYLGAFALSFFVVVPSMRSAVAEIEGAAPLAEGEKPKRPGAYAAVAATAGVTTILLVVVVVLMAARPTL